MMNFWQDVQANPTFEHRPARIEAMARKKKSAQTDAAPGGSAASTPPPPANGAPPATKKPANEPSTSALIICRNK
jgi:hypothetical protein